MTETPRKEPILSDVERNLLSEEHEKWLKRSSRTFAQCAIHLMLTHMSFAEVIEFLSSEIQLLKDTPGSGIDETTT